ncbi:MAG: hypothetical protein LUG21_04145 [Clostridiales bacterium]|nr:hypothetical protein [Clostridiales bacterium]
MNPTMHFFENIDTKYLTDKYKNAPAIFICTVLDSVNQFECTKHKIMIDKMIKGSKGDFKNSFYLYEYNNFIISDEDKLMFSQTVSKNILMKNGNKYLVFAEPIVYDKTYQQKIACSEFRILGEEINYFCLNENQSKPINPNSKLFKDISYAEFSCFSDAGLKNINSIKKEIIEIYT